jgi:ketosteroid isomerase-like protein
MIRPGVLCSCFLLASLSAQTAHVPGQAQRKPSDAIFATLRADWAQRLREKKIDACVSEYAPDGEFIQPDGTSVRGSDALRSLFAMVTRTFDSDLVFDSSRVEVSGTLAYDAGTYHETLIVRASGKQQSSTGSYLTVYRRSSSGEWLIVEQAWTGTIK